MTASGTMTEQKAGIMKKFIQERYLIPLGVWFMIYMALFLYLEICEPESVHLILCSLDRKLPYIQTFVYPYLSWFPYICTGTYLAVRNLEEKDYKRAVFLLTAGMNVFLLISYVWPTGLDLREGIIYNTTLPSGYLMRFIQTVDAPRSVFPSMHVYVTLVLQYTLELQKGRLSMRGIWIGRLFAVLIILSTMFTKQHSVLDVLGAFLLFGLLGVMIQCRRSMGSGKIICGRFLKKTTHCVDKEEKTG